MGDCFAPLGPPLLPWDLMAQKDTQTDGHGDSMTNSAQWGRVGENLIGDLFSLKKLLTILNC